MSSLRLLKCCCAVSLFGSLVACGEDTMEPEPSNPVIAAVSGNGQSATTSQTLANPLVVRVTRDGDNVSGTNVSWTVTGGGGSVDPSSSSTGADGTASTTWTLGPDPGANSVEASASGTTGSPVVFGATATSSMPPTQASVSVDDNFFDPSTATIATGGSVTWTWVGNDQHNVTFSSGTNSATLTNGGTFTRSFPDAGSFDYLCTIHGSTMSGTIVVQ